MNCEPGDLAVITKSWAGNEGRIVRVVCWIGKIDGWSNSDRWEIEAERPLISSKGRLHFHAPDSFMRPIRDPGEDARDETLQWLPVPSIEKETA